jgi:hypothetical protein
VQAVYSRFLHDYREEVVLGVAELFRVFPKVLMCDIGGGFT